MIGSQAYTLATRAAQVLLQAVDPTLVVDGSWGTFTQGVFAKAPAGVKQQIERVIQAVAQASPSDLLVFRQAEKRTVIKGDRTMYKSAVQPALRMAATGRFANPALLLAQLDLESDNGKKLPAQHNYSGIKWFDIKSGPYARRVAKYGASSGSVVNTNEGWGSTLRTEKAKFMAFPNVDAYVGYYLDYLAEVFPKTLTARTPTEFVAALKVGQQGGYAQTNPASYAGSVSQIVAQRYA